MILGFIAGFWVATAWWTWLESLHEPPQSGDDRLFVKLQGRSDGQALTHGTGVIAYDTNGNSEDIDTTRYYPHWPRS